MKLVAIMCVEQYIERAKHLLYDLKIEAFSETDLQGYKKDNDDESTNWFGSKKHFTSSKMVFTLCDDKKADEIMQAVEICKHEIKDNPVHAFVLNVEQVI
ncbi:MAG: hypothetical protein JEY94_13570 [Melioribacteraceae bacterium]|nr:hypothetical protein [Melioribacteraceae bacterium]